MREPETGERPESIRAVERVCDILDLVQTHPEGVTLADVVAAVELPKTSAFRYLATLEERSYLHRDTVTGRMRIGSALLRLRSSRLSALTEHARPLLERLRDELGETVNLGLLDGHVVSYLAIAESPRTVRLAARLEDREPLHCTALGKAIASTLDDARVTGILEAEGMAARTPRTLTSPSAYLADLAVTRARGYALDDEENEEDGRCVAVPLIGIGLPAAISVSAPASRFLDHHVAHAVRVLSSGVTALLTSLRSAEG